MSKLQRFLKYLKRQVESHSLYLWGGQGEYIEKKGRVDMQFIASMEQSAGTAKSVADKIIDCYKNGYDMSKARFFDCSGLGVYFFLKYGFIEHDMTAAELYRRCKSHPESDDLKPGDMVFKGQTANGYGHVGYCSGYDEKSGEPLITEARGRAYGVQTRVYSVGEWIATGRTDWFE